MMSSAGQPESRARGIGTVGGPSPVAAVHRGRETVQMPAAFFSRPGLRLHSPSVYVSYCAFPGSSGPIVGDGLVAAIFSEAFWVRCGGGAPGFPLLVPAP